MGLVGDIYKSNGLANPSWKRQFFQGIIITSIILFLPFLNYVHLLFKTDSNELKILGFIIDHGYPNNQVFVWFLISDVISLFYLVAVIWFSFGFWRYFLILAIVYFATYPIWMFNSEYDRYFSFLSSFYGIITITITLVLIKFLDYYIKERLFKDFLILSSVQIFNEMFLSKESKFNRQILKTIKDRASLTLKEYSCRLYYYRQLAYSSYRNYYLLSSIKRIQKSIRRNYVLGSLVLLITLLLFLHKAFPDNVHEIEFFGFQIGTFGFQDIGTLLYHVSQKFVICVILIIWFITCEFWWRWAILSPILFYSYQFWESFQPVREIDGSGNLAVFPLVFLTIFGVFLLSKAIRRISINLDYQVFLEEELDKTIRELSRLEGGA